MPRRKCHGYIYWYGFKDSAIDQEPARGVVFATYCLDASLEDGNHQDLDDGF